jgi:ABC-type multidrug transport system fused ATPase/permease subunit
VTVFGCLFIRQGYAVTSKFETIHKQFNAKSFAAGSYTKHVQWTANAVPALFSAAVMIVVGGAVTKGQMSVAAFVVFVSTVNAFGPTIGAVFNDLFAIGRGFADIQKVGLGLFAAK